MSAGQDIADRGHELSAAGVHRALPFGLGSSRSALLTVSFLYLVTTLAWSLQAGDPGSLLANAAITAAAALAVALVLALLAAQEIARRTGVWSPSWSCFALALLALAVAHIAEAAIHLAEPRIGWNPAWLLALRIAAALALAASVLVASDSPRERLPERLGRAVVVLTLATAIVLVGWLATGAHPPAGTILATALPLAACLLVATEHIAARPRPRSAIPTATLGSLVAVAAWSTAVFIRQLGDWHHATRFAAFGLWLIPLAALGWSAAALSAIASGDDPWVNNRANRQPVPEPAVVLALAVILALAAIGVLVEPAVDLPLLAALALALYLTKQTMTIRLARDQVALILEESVELERAANLDHTTGLPNRAALDGRMREEFERAVRYHQPLSLCVVDIDHFKSVNDRFGHPVGDLVLRAVGKSLRQSARGVDFVGRFGGEEFVVVAPGTWSADAEILAERLRSQVERLVFASDTGGSFGVTISLGLAGYPEHAEELDLLFTLADRALYRSKQEGRNRATLHGKPQAD